MSAPPKNPNTGNRDCGANGEPMAGDSGFSTGRAKSNAKGVLMAFKCVGFQDGIAPESRFSIYQLEFVRS
jgi:hypothetical protein